MKGGPTGEVHSHLWEHHERVRAILIRKRERHWKGQKKPSCYKQNSLKRSTSWKRGGKRGGEALGRNPAFLRRKRPARSRGGKKGARLFPVRKGAETEKKLRRNNKKTGSREEEHPTRQANHVLLRNRDRNMRERRDSTSNHRGWFWQKRE